MPRDGSGNYTLPTPGNPVVFGTPIDDVVHNLTNADIASALTGSIARDGQSQALSNLPMGGFRHLNVAPAVQGNEYATLSQEQTNVSGFVVAVAQPSNPNLIVISPNPPITSYVAGQRFRVLLANTNTSATTIAVGSLTAKSVLLQRRQALPPGILVAGYVADLVYDGTAFILLNPDVSFNALSTNTNRLIETKQVSSAPSVIFTVSSADFLSFKRFRFSIGPDARISADGFLVLQFSENAGATFLTATGAYSSGFESHLLGTVSESVPNDTNTSGVIGVNLTGNIAGMQEIYGVTDVEFTAGFVSSELFVRVVSLSERRVIRAWGQRNTTGGINAVRFLPSSGALVSGRFAMTGMV